MPNPQRPAPESSHPMPQVVVGPWGRLEAHLCREVSKRRRSAPFAPLYIIVPNPLLKRHLETVLAESAGGLLNVWIDTPENLADRWTRDPAPPPLTASTLRPLVAKAIQETTGPDAYFAPLKDHPRLPAMFVRLAQGCSAAGATPDHFRRAAGDAGALRGRKLVDLARFLERLEAILPSNARSGGEEPSEHRSAGNALGEDAPPAPRETASARNVGPAADLLFYGFDLPPPELDPLSRPAEATMAPIVVYLCRRPPWLEEDLGAPAQRWGGGPCMELEDGDEGIAPTLAHLASALFAPPHAISDPAASSSDPIPDPAALQVVSAPDPATEVRRIAGEILELNRRGVPFDRVLVTFRRAADYATVLEEVFSEYGVPFQATFPASLATTPVVRTVRLLLSLVRTDLPAAEVLELLVSPWLKPEAYLPADSPQPDRFAWDTLARQAGVRFQDPQWRSRIEALLEDSASRDPDTSEGRARRGRLEQVGLFETVVTGLSGDLSTFPERAPASVYAARVRALIRKVIAREHRVPNRPELPTSNLEVGIRALLAFDELLEETADLDRTVPDMTWEAYLEHLEETCHTRTFPATAGKEGGVRVAALPSVTGVRADYVFLAGMVSRLFPAPDPEDPVLSIRDRAALNQAGARFLISDLGLGEKRLFLDAVLATRRRLVLTFHRTDSTGREQLPSPFIREVWRAFFGTRVFQRDFQAHRPLFKEVRYNVAELGNWARRWELGLIRQARAIPGKTPAAFRLAAWLARTPDMASAFRAERDRWSLPHFTAFDGILGPTWRDTSKPLRVSASQIEQTAACPFLYLASRIWGLEPLAPRGGPRTITALDRGLLYHDLLEALIGRGLDSVEASGDTRNAPRIRQNDDATVLSFVQSKLDAFEQTHPTGHPALWAAEREQITRDILSVLRRQATDQDRFRPYRVESRFGPSRHDEAPCVRLELPGIGLLEVSGRIDRIDIDPETLEARVVDYKTGRAPTRNMLRKDIASGRRVQPVLYLEAARALVPEGYEVVAFCYDYVTERAGGFQRRILETGELEDLDEPVQHALAVLGAILREGAFFPWPDGACRYCDYALICRRSPEARFKRKETDPRAEAYIGACVSPP